jgi:hypothetical protein
VISPILLNNFLELQIYEEACTLKHETILKSCKKHDGTEDDVEPEKKWKFRQ